MATTSPRVAPDPREFSVYQRQRREQRRREMRRHRQDLCWSLGLSLIVHGGALWLTQADLFPSADPRPQLIEFRLIPPQELEVIPSAPDLMSVADSQSRGASDPEDPEFSAGGSPHSSTSLAAPPREISPPTQPQDAAPVVRSAPVASLQRPPQPTPDPVTTLHQQLEQAVADQDWQEATAIIDQMAMALPQRVGEFSAYRDQLQQLAQPQADPAPETPLPNPTPALSESTPPPSPRPVSPTPAPPPATAAIATAVFPPAPPVIPASAPPTSPTTISKIRPGSGTGGQVSGVANVQQSEPGETQLATIADPAWAEYIARLQVRVQQHWSVREAQDSYSTVVVFTLSQQGQLQTLRLQNPSQDPLVDAAVMSAIRQAAPFDPLPTSFTGEQFTFQLDVLSGSREVIVRSP